MATDFVPIVPYEASVITLGIGQRYTIVVEANASLAQRSDFWIHTHFCGFPELLDSRVGIIRYDGRSKRDPPTPPPAHQDFGCADPAPSLLRPIVRRKVGNRVNGLEAADYLKIGLEWWPNATSPAPDVEDPSQIDTPRIHRWALKNVPMQLDWEQPSLKKLALDPPNRNLSALFPEETEPIVLDFESGEWVYFVITNNYTVEEAFPVRSLPQSVHPIHLHGHDLLVLAQGEGPFTADTPLQLDNPSRRDVTNCPLNGHVVIAFQVNNPGAWLLHCHIAWHASSGLGIQFIEQPRKIRNLLQRSGALPDLAQRCQKWTSWYETKNKLVGAVQHDSGV